MDDGLSCPICMNRFNEGRQVPLVLGCGHTFCRDCLTSLASTKRQLRCPTCNRSETIQVTDLPRNYVLSEILLAATTLGTGGETENPMACKLHPSEQICFVSASTRQPYCHDCVSYSNCEDLVALDSTSISKHLQRFKQLYEVVSTIDLENRAEYVSTLGSALQGHKMRVVTELEDAHRKAMLNFERQFSKYKNQVHDCFEDEKEKLLELARVLRFLKDMKSAGVKFDNITSYLNLQRQVLLAPALPALAEVGITAKLQELTKKSFSYKGVTELNPSNFNVPLAIIESPMKLIEGGSFVKDTEVKKLSRFPTPTNRWGIFDGRNQVEAVTITVNQRISIVAIGIGCAFHENKLVTCEVLQICDGPATNSPIIGEILGAQLPNCPERSTRLDFKSTVELQPNRDYTIRAIIRGDAGVYRGGATSRTKTTAQGVTFKFKTSAYGPEDVKNGDNADDGPILDIYYNLSSGGEDTEVSLSRFASLEAQWPVRPSQIEAVTFEFSRQVTLKSLGIGASILGMPIASLQAIRILKGPSTRSPQIAEFIGPLELRPSEPGTQFTKVKFASPPMLEAHTKYTVKLNYATTVQVYRGIGPFPAISNSGIIMKTEAAVYEGGDIAFGDNVKDGPIFSLFVSAPSTDQFCRVCEIPISYEEQLGGVAKLSRFESHEKHWHFNNSKQVESFSFTFNKAVLMTGIGLGNSITPGTSFMMKSLKILMGGSTVGPEIYRSTKPIKIFNKDDTLPVVKVDLECPVRVEAEATYTIRVVLRGEAKSYKGKTHRGASISGFGGVTMKSSKCTLGGEDKRNGDNETGGPIFDFYYLPIDSQIDIEQFNKATALVIPSLSKQAISLPAPAIVGGVEHCYKRLSSIGNGWHINTDGKQIEALSFKISKACAFSAIGIGNAHEETKKVIVSSLTVIEGKSTRGPRLYKHSIKEKLMNTGPDSRFVKVVFSAPIALNPEAYYTIRIKYKPGSSVVRGTTPANSGSVFGASIVFEKSTFEGGDVENGSHETHGPLRDFYFLV